MSRAFFPSPPKPQSRIVEFRKWMSFVVPKTSESLFPQTNTSKTESLLQNKSAFEVPGVSVSGFEEFLVPKFSETFGGIKRRPFRGLALPNVTLLAGLDLTKQGWLLWVSLDWIGSTSTSALQKRMRLFIRSLSSQLSAPAAPAAAWHERCTLKSVPKLESRGAPRSGTSPNTASWR